ncbi:sulfatase-like hydrolase/transferase [Rhodopirellula sp. SWK7]|uniref:sulfatase-like hydrolase/transferase n=1 Tax=Rhodopirellula sp. SWK7 TaxID=595460 RepID=UPI0002BEE0A9|nr:N-acetyl-galactosamine-6-sulfate sulfatase (GALNS) [Rhodopirellula sp. SWK7]
MMMNRLFTACFLAFLTTLTATSLHAERPNVVFLLSDDQGWNDYGLMGHPHIQTPALDELAKRGLVYERGYVTAPLCRPSLASLVTGMYPHQIGIRGNDPVLPAGTNRKEVKYREISTEFRDRMTAPMLKFPSFVKELQKNGYATLQTGKWWEGNPLDHGFTDAMTHGDHSRGGRHGDVGLKIGRETMQPIYDFVDKADENQQPFFIWYGVFLPHAPHNAPDRLFNKYKDIAPDEPTARYWANVEWLDEGCGQIVDYLKQKNMYENTIFVFTCDNGWVQNPERKNVSIRSKREPVEAGIRTPIFITHEGAIKPARNKTTLASNIDIATTILHACDIQPPAEMTGLDLRDPESLQERNRVFVDVYEHDSDLDHLEDLDNGLVARVVIDGWNKLIARPTGNELYDLKSDPDDRVDVSEKHPEQVSSMVSLLNKWVAQPSANP